MGTIKTSARWTGEALNFTGVDPKGNEVALGKSDIAPSHLILIGLAGCTGMDVVSILQKKRQEVTDVIVEVSAQQPDEYPKPFQKFQVNFIVKGKDIDPEAVARSIELSSTKYCVVSQTLEYDVEISTSYKVEAA